MKNARTLFIISESYWCKHQGRALQELPVQIASAAKSTEKCLCFSHHMTAVAKNNRVKKLTSRSENETALKNEYCKH